MNAALLDTTIFLRLCYRPEEVTTANLAGVLGSLPGLLRLANKLDMPRIQATVVEAMKGEGRHK